MIFAFNIFTLVLQCVVFFICIKFFYTIANGIFCQSVLNFVVLALTKLSVFFALKFVALVLTQLSF